jgi:hypothetical protein
LRFCSCKKAVENIYTPKKKVLPVWLVLLFLQAIVPQQVSLRLFLLIPCALEHLQAFSRYRQRFPGHPLLVESD